MTIALGLALLSMPTSGSAQKALQSLAFYYAAPLPVDELSAFDQVVVEPTYVSKSSLLQLKEAGSHVFAYVSIGEARREKPWFFDIDTAWVAGRNNAWNSAVMDLSNEQWQDFIVEHLVAPLVEKGYSGLFLDTLDSYFIVADTPEMIQAQQQGLVQVIQKMRKAFPDLKLLFNRGFEVIADVQSLVDGVVAESLIQRWNAESKVYERVPKQDYTWLKQKLSFIKDSLHLPVYVIDYVAPSQRKLARKTAKEIAALGFTPWVSNPGLDMLGISHLEVIPRKVIVLYDSLSSKLPYSRAHRYLASPLEYMGYIIEYMDVRNPLPAVSLVGKYAGIVTWFSAGAMNVPRPTARWLVRNIDEGIPVALLNTPGIKLDSLLLKRLGLKSVEGKVKSPVKITHVDDVGKMEVSPKPLTRYLTPLIAIDPEIEVHVSIKDARQKKMDVILTAPWGGMALAPFVLEEGLEGHVRWRLNIFKFLEKALHYKAMPVFDVTTENGSRLLMTHIDGDGAASYADMPNKPLAIRVIHDEILKKYPFPATVSVITGEMEDGGLYPKRAAKMRKIARESFSLPHVEIASHTYSHPFHWLNATYKHDSKAYLKIPGYVFSLEKEVPGSVQYINENIAPKGKKVKVFLWSGNALPGEKALELAASLGLRSMNGGNTMATRDHPSITDVSSMMRPVGKQMQIYAPVMNENLYTHNWTKPLYGFGRVIETFKFTEYPRRLKPIDIYYHFYSGSEFASLSALQRVYDWSMQQETLPVWVSEYVDKVEAYAHAVAAKRLDGSWVLRSSPALKTVRITKEMGWPNLRKSRGIAGVRDLKQGRYLHLTGKETRYELHLQKRAPTQPHLIRANASIMNWSRRGNQVRMRLRGHMPIAFSLNKPCTLNIGAQQYSSVKNEGFHTFSLKLKDTGNARISCQ
ncbi:MAG: bifunctional glycoside hydrolase 114/ polysaccharide deacetylase family protein [Mariprofundaceae bacterium]